MATLILRLVKGSPLTNAELDNNLTNLNNDIATRLLSSTYTASDILSKLVNVDGAGSTLDADFFRGLAPTSVNTVSTVVTRDASGNFAAGTITASLTGSVSGTSSNVTGNVAVANGGTGTTTSTGTGSVVLNTSPTIAGAPIFTGTSIQFTGSNAGFEVGGLGSTNSPYFDFHSGATTVDYDSRIIASGGTGTAGQGILSYLSGSHVFTGIVTLNTALAVTSGGTGATTSAQALINLNAETAGNAIAFSIALS